MDEIRALIDAVWAAGDKLPPAPPRTPIGDAHAVIAKCLGSLTEVIWYAEHAGPRPTDRKDS